ncbi:Asp-tRNAAsn/Glu-tRNAGln amidotransferase A subunit or related amidase [Geosmithia morbida]|uniref:Asp-tRNAAsn/Glu-tRNAGln amidotransferase A subunit or related amidase n=1 Tax=Geosmithia morbida TaxID=1094350 RepID=A0A9P4Z0J3_9HYPO|nr:Asp-tRNAAsn/Glu-tRNAGln amidotransferase A subunit or related amidase [Geosmithia morbida]KAF4125053.1 Asp-tRNAAsn/Glu-tRNAGln amidotransferase A subunit or related amidase [Geosmithia morbida]
MSPSSFADYPEPVKAGEARYRSLPEPNPKLHGLPLVLVANVMTRVNAVPNFFWSNAGFGTIKDMPELDDPTVTPLGDNTMLDFEPELLESKRATGANGANYYSAADYHAMYRSGKVTPLQVTQTLLAVTKKGQEPRSLYADAWADWHGKESLALEAARASTERYAAGEPLGVLDGVPIGVKDDTDVRGYVSHVGMKYKAGLDFFKERESTIWCVQKLEEAGAVVLGKNCMHELGSGTPTNHYNKSYYTGGSTSGGASALGAGIVPIVVGSDAGGSIRIPATFNGVYGLKPSHNRTGFFNMTMAVRGPLAASVADLRIAYRLMSQPDPASAVQRLFATSRRPGPDAERVMGVYRDWWADADPEVVRICDAAVEHLASKRGYRVVDISIPHVAEARTAHQVLCITEMAELHRRRAAGDPAGWTGLVGAANRMVLSVGMRTPSADYLKCNALRELMMRHVASLFREHPGLLVVTPTSPMVGWPRDPAEEAYGCSDTNRTVRNMMYIFLSNMTGAPSVSAPAGYARPPAGRGEGDGTLPIGLMAMGEWGAEEQLLDWAAEVEDYLLGSYEGGRRLPETWFDVLGEAEAAQKNDE